MQLCTGDQVILKPQTAGSWKHVEGKYHRTIALFLYFFSRYLLFTLIIMSAMLNEGGLGPLGSGG